MTQPFRRAMSALIAAGTTFIVIYLLVAATRLILDVPGAPQPTTSKALTEEVPKEAIAALIALMTGVFWYIAVGANPSTVSKDRPAPEEGQVAAHTDAGNAPPVAGARPLAAGVPQDVYELMEARKNEYKHAFFKTRDNYRYIFAALHDSGVIKDSDLVGGLDVLKLQRRLWRNRATRWTLLTALFIIIAYFAGGQLQTLAYRLQPAGVDASDMPWYLLYAHSLTMLVSIPTITAIVFARTRGALTPLQNLSDALALGPIAAVIAGLTFLFQLSPEDVVILHSPSNNYALKAFGVYETTLWDWRFIQRFVLFPLVALFGPLFVLAVMGMRR